MYAVGADTHYGIFGTAVKINGQALDLSDSPVRTVGDVTVSFKKFEAGMGTVLTMSSPFVGIAVNLVRFKRKQFLSHGVA